MTTRDEARRGRRSCESTRLGPSCLPIPSRPCPSASTPARERKGVDLYGPSATRRSGRAISPHLERGDYRELPGAVYTKGFLRNYALYLGLEPDEILGQWRRERGDAGPPQPVIAVPRPIVTPRRGLTFSPGVVVAALLTVAVILVGGYLAVQIMRYAKPPTLTVTDPKVATLTVEQDTASYLLRGTTIPGGTVTVELAGGTRQISADSTGAWSIDVDLRRGKNQLKIDATDPTPASTPSNRSRSSSPSRCPSPTSRSHA